MMICIAGLQVFIVRFFFQVSSTLDFWAVVRLMKGDFEQGARKGYV